MRFLVYLAADYRSAALDELDVLLREVGLEPRACFARPTGSTPDVPDPRIDQDLNQDPMQEVDLPDLVHAKRVLARAVLVKAIYHVWASGRTLHEVVSRVAHHVPQAQKDGVCGEGVTWRFVIDSWCCGLRDNAARTAVRDHFRGVLGPRGKVKLGVKQGADSYGDLPDVTLAVVMAHYEQDKEVQRHADRDVPLAQEQHLPFPDDVCGKAGVCTLAHEHDGAGAAHAPGQAEPSWVWFGTKVVVHEDEKDGQGRPLLPPGARAGDNGCMRHLLHTLSLKSRPYLGPTSLDAQLASLMASLARAGPGRIVYDPFAGTGSCIIAAAAMGAMTMGSDLDARVLRGKMGRNMQTNYSHYGLGSPELIRTDMALFPAHIRPHPLGWVDAIVTDPPYGVRAGARKMAAPVKDGDGEGKATPSPAVDPSSPRPIPVPATELYEPDGVIIDLLDGAAQWLVKGGRLVYLYPSISSHAMAMAAGGRAPSSFLLPLHPCLTIESVSEEPLTPLLARFLVTMVKRHDYDQGARDAYREVTRATARAAAQQGDPSHDPSSSSSSCFMDRLGGLMDGWYKARRDELPAVATKVLGTRAPQDIVNRLTQASQAAAGSSSDPSSPGPALVSMEPLTSTEDASEDGSPGPLGMSKNAAKREAKRLVRQAKRDLKKEQAAEKAEGGSSSPSPKVDPWVWEALKAGRPVDSLPVPEGVKLTRKERHLLAILADVQAGRPVRISSVPYDMPPEEWAEFKARVGLPTDFPWPQGWA